MWFKDTTPPTGGYNSFPFFLFSFLFCLFGENISQCGLGPPSCLEGGLIIHGIAQRPHWGVIFIIPSAYTGSFMCSTHSMWSLPVQTGGKSCMLGCKNSRRSCVNLQGRLWLFLDLLLWLIRGCLAALGVKMCHSTNCLSDFARPLSCRWARHNCCTKINRESRSSLPQGQKFRNQFPPKCEAN